jgi:hypothetical protein
MWDLNFGTWISHRGLHSGLRPWAPTSQIKVANKIATCCQNGHGMASCCLFFFFFFFLFHSSLMLAGRRKDWQQIVSDSLRRWCCSCCCCTFLTSIPLYSRRRERKKPRPAPSHDHHETGWERISSRERAGERSVIESYNRSAAIQKGRLEGPKKQKELMTRKSGTIFASIHRSRFTRAINSIRAAPPAISRCGCNLWPLLQGCRILIAAELGIW